jgi:hypothetical protein
MADIVSDGFNAVQATGQRVRDGVGAAATGIRGEIDSLRHHAEHAPRRDKRSVWQLRLIELVASIAGAVAAFIVSRLVRGGLRARGE